MSKRKRRLGVPKKEFKYRPCHIPRNNTRKYHGYSDCEISFKDLNYKKHKRSNRKRRRDEIKEQFKDFEKLYDRVFRKIKPTSCPLTPYSDAEKNDGEIEMECHVTGKQRGFEDYFKLLLL